MIVLAALFGAMCIGIWLFPAFQKAIQRQDCIAVGRNDCD